MKSGIQWQKELATQESAIKETEFQYIEIPFGDATDEIIHNAEAAGLFISGLQLDGCRLSKEELSEAIAIAEEKKLSYLTISTMGVTDSAALQTVLETSVSQIKETGIKLYIENGCAKTAFGSYICNEFSEAADLLNFVKELEKSDNQTDEEQAIEKTVGVCLNIGVANLTGKNIRMMLELFGDYLGLIHANDNDGKSMQNQMPYTFTTGRGTSSSTDWYRMVGALVRSKFDGFMIFNVTGLFQRAPEKLYKAYLQLLSAVEKEWQEQFMLSVKLGKEGRKIILFGAGVMAQNYMDAWGEKYPPAFIADNNQANHGKKRFGVEIISPETILEIPEEERYVLICNQYYDEVGAQLRQMGISYECYLDHYYL